MHLKEVSIKLTSYILFHCGKEIASLTVVRKWEYVKKLHTMQKDINLTSYQQ